ncbi:hypothetical protein [Snodgrassella alvi]|uniref:hypothetical protein n=1 Tax=Snodgrassella alvi TaxID=1196083 RepID=UPI0015531A56|nr:hypothetical protein [Snodgrassella alvi]
MDKMEETFTCVKAHNRYKCGTQTIRDGINTRDLIVAKIDRNWIIRQTNLDI